MRHHLALFGLLFIFISAPAGAHFSQILYLKVRHNLRPVSSVFLPEVFEFDDIDLILRRTHKGNPMKLIGFRHQRYGRAEMHIYQGVLRTFPLFDHDYGVITALQYDAHFDLFSLQFRAGWGKRWLTVSFPPNESPAYKYGRFGGFFPHDVSHATWLDGADLQRDPFKKMVIPESELENLPKVVVVGCAETVSKQPTEPLPETEMEE